MTLAEQNPRIQAQAVLTELRSKHIAMARDQRFVARLDGLLECDEQGRPLPLPIRYTSTGETRGIVVTDGPGGGKTSLVRHALSRHLALQSRDRDERPCISITVPSPATSKSVGREILAACGYPLMSANRTAWDIWGAVRTKFRQLGTVVLWIDEAHDLFRSRSPADAEETLKTLKSLMQGENAVIVVLSGIDSLWDDISFDAQVRRRYSRFALAPMSFGDGDMLWKILSRFCETAGLGLGPRTDLPERMIHAGRKRFGRCVEQMLAAIEVAIMERSGELCAEHFAEAFAAQEGCSTDQNVFLVPRWAEIELI
jgi:hypothetical protein